MTVVLHKRTCFRFGILLKAMYVVQALNLGATQNWDLKHVSDINIELIQ